MCVPTWSEVPSGQGLLKYPEAPPGLGAPAPPSPERAAARRERSGVNARSASDHPHSTTVSHYWDSGTVVFTFSAVLSHVADMLVTYHLLG